MTLIVAIILFLLICLLWRTNVYVYVEYHRDSDNDYLKIRCVIFRRITLYEIILPSIDATEKQGFFRFKSRMAVKNRLMVNDSESFNCTSGLKINLKKPRQIFGLLKHFKLFMKAYRRTMIHLLKNTDCEYFSWITAYGADDAGTTCVTVGWLWMLKGMFINSLAKHIKFHNRPAVNVIPFFDKKRLSIDLEASIDSMIIASRGVNWRWLSTQYKV